MTENPIAGSMDLFVMKIRVGEARAGADEHKWKKKSVHLRLNKQASKAVPIYTQSNGNKGQASRQIGKSKGRIFFDCLSLHLSLFLRCSDRLSFPVILKDDCSSIETKRSETQKAKEEGFFLLLFSGSGSGSGSGSFLVLFFI